MTARVLPWFEDDAPRDLLRWSAAAAVVAAVHVGLVAPTLRTLRSLLRADQRGASILLGYQGGGVSVLHKAIPFALCAIASAVPIAPHPAFAQDSSNSTVTLPQINVIGTAPIPPARRATERARPAPRAAAPAPASAAANTGAAAPAAAEPGAVDRDKVPANVQTLSSTDFDKTTAASLLDALARGLPGAALGDQTGNEFQRDFNYRGFVASPVIGTPQGLAVYQNGVRINEVFGDIVNWDFIPQNAIARMTLVPSNPVYGLNAIGGALSFEMKNGFTYHGAQGELSSGSYGRVGA
jgi:iron complex outermembrane receptor protein